MPLATVIVPTVAQVATSAAYSITDIGLLVWLIGQVVVQIINAWKGPTVSSKQSSEAIAGLQQQVAQVQQNQLPPEVMSNFVNVVGQLTALRAQMTGTRPAATTPTTTTPRPPATPPQQP